MAQRQLLPLVAVDFYLDPACQVLAEVVNFFALGRRKFLDDRQFLQTAHRLIFLPNDCVKAVVKQLGGLRRGRRGGKVLRLAVVNFGELHCPGRAKPALVGADPFLAPVGVGNAERSQRGGGVAVVVGFRHKAQRAFIPAVCQRQRHAVFAAVQRYGAGLVLQALAVVRPAGVEIAVVHRRAVDLRFIHTQGCGVKACFFDIALHDKVLVQHRAYGGILVKGACDPLRLALKRAAAQKTGFKAACGFGSFAVVVRHGDQPCIFGARRKIGTEVLVQNALRTRHRAGIPDGFAAAGQLQTVGGLQGVLAVAFQLPAKAGLNFI